MKKFLFISRQFLLCVLLLQLLNLSICSDSYVDTCTVENNRTVAVTDPTETIVEWVVEWKKGNQDRFSYNNNINLKGLSKNFCWHIDMQHGFPIPVVIAKTGSPLSTRFTSHRPLSAQIDILSPPPEC